MVQRDPISASEQSAQIEQIISDYFAQAVHREEYHPICLVGCGQAGTELAGIFRLKPEFVPAYLPQYYPVRAVAMDTQANLSDNLKQRVGWYEPPVQLHLDPPTEDRVELLLEQGANQQQDSGGWADTTPFDVSRVARSGGAGGFALRGRATAVHHFGADTPLRQQNTDILDRARLLSRQNSGYLLTFSGLGGGTGSGVVPVVVGYIQERLAPPPSGTFSICVVPEWMSDNISLSNFNERDPRLLSNLLAALYYLVTTPAINGIILSDNLQLESQGHKDLLRIDRYLQDVLMPVFLAAQSRYIYRTQLDPANVRLAMAPRGDGRHEFIAACFAICPFPGASKRILDMEQQTAIADPVTQVPELGDLLETALRNPTIQCETDTARSVLAVLSGPPEALERMVPDVESGVRFQEALRVRCVEARATTSSVEGGFSRFFLAKFPNMTDVRLTVLLSAPRFPALEHALRTALNDRNWGPAMGRETLADALRRVDESTVRRIGLAHIRPG